MTAVLVSSELDPATAALDEIVEPGDGWMRVLRPVRRCGSSICTETRPSTRCSTTPMTPRSATAPQDTIREQGAIYLTTGSRLLTGSGRTLVTIVADTCGRHDTLGGACSQESNVVRYGEHTRHMHACRQTFLAQALAWGLDKRDITHNVNFFMNVPVTPEGVVDVRGRGVGAGQVRRDARRARRDRAHQQLPAAQQPVQRLQPDGRCACWSRTGRSARRVTIDVLAAGPMTKLQVYPGRLGLWPVGVPPSGPMDALSFRLANRLAGNPSRAAALEITVGGLRAALRLRRDDRARRCADGRHAGRRAGRCCGSPSRSATGRSSCSAGRAAPACAATSRSRAGSTCPRCWAAAHVSARPLRRPRGTGAAARRHADDRPRRPRTEPRARRSRCDRSSAYAWTLRVTSGPHDDEEYLTARDLAEILSRLPGTSAPSPTAPACGSGPGAGLVAWRRRRRRPAPVATCTTTPTSSARSFFTGDAPVPRSGPTAPRSAASSRRAVVIRADLWKLGQLRPGDARAPPGRSTPPVAAASRRRSGALPGAACAAVEGGRGRAGRPDRAAAAAPDDVAVRTCGDSALLVEFGQTRSTFACGCAPTPLAGALGGRAAAGRRLPDRRHPLAAGPVRLRASVAA